MLKRTLMKAAIKRSRHLFKSVANTVEECPYKKHKRDRSGDRKHRDGDHHGHRGDYHGHRGDKHRGEHRRQRSSWLDTFAAYMNEFANLAGDVGLDTEAKAPEAAQQNQQPEEQAKNAQATETGKQPEPSTSAETPHCPVFPGNFNAESIQKLIENFLGGTYTGASQRPNASATNAQCPFTPADLNVETIQKLISMYLGGNVNTTQQATPNSADEAPATANDVEMEHGDKNHAENEGASVHTETSYATVTSEKDASPDRADDWMMINSEKGKLNP